MDTIVSPSSHAAALWSGLIVLLMVVLSVLVVRQRQQHHVLFGDGGVPQLQQAIRAFGNAAEYGPLGLAVLALLALVGAQPLLIHAVGLLLFLGRLGHAIGISFNPGTSIPRAGGIMLTWLALIFGGAVLLFYGVP